nr:ABC transporter ATP-binding protein [uncultured Sphingomonas sp.]
MSLRYRDMFRPRDYFVMGAIAVGYALSIVTLLVLVRMIVAALNGHSGTITLPVLITLLAVTGLANAGLKALEFTVPEIIGYRIVRELRIRLYRHMAAMAPRQIQHRSRGSLILRLTGDLTMLRTWLSRGLCRGAVALVALIASIAVVAWYSPLIALVTLLVFGVGLLSSLYVGRLLQRVTSRVRRRRSLLTSNVDEQVNALSVVQLFGRLRGEEGRFDRQNVLMTEALYTEARYRGVLRGISTAAGWMALVAALIVSAIEAGMGIANVGNVLVAILATRLMQTQVRTLALSHDYWRRAEISRHKLQDFLRSRSRLLDDDGDRLVHNRAPIRFDNVVVEGSLSFFNAEVAAGQHIAITGPSGSGKSTLLQAASAMVDCNAGSITIGQQVVEHCSAQSIWRKMGFVGPDLPLMRGTLRRNLTYRKPSVSDEELQAHLVRCGLDGLARSLPDGFDFWVTEGGANLPNGTRQQIAIARALLGNPPILMLDRASAQLDADGRTAFRDLLARYSGTILSVTDDAEEMALADQVWTVRDGRLDAAEPSALYLARRARRPFAAHRPVRAS